MEVIRVRNVHEALPEGIRKLVHLGDEQETRNGPVLVLDDPLTTVYEKPCERVLFWKDRDANPFFHFMEGLWMLAGRNDVAWISYFNSKFGQFSDDGETFHGAYGYRWRQHFGFDQLGVIAARLKENPNDRRQVLQIWDAQDDLANQDSKDLPCNDLVMFSRHRDGVLDMTVLCRSNDIIWGCYGSNAVHFSMLHEFMAGMIGCPVGIYRQVSNNWHGYKATMEPLLDLVRFTREPGPGNELYYNPYEAGDVEPFPMMEGDPAQWHNDLAMFMEAGQDAVGYQTRFFRRVALPLLMAWNAFKDEGGVARYDAALGELKRCEASDWRLACEQWIERRRAAYIKKQTETA